MATGSLPRKSKTTTQPVDGLAELARLIAQRSPPASLDSLPEVPEDVRELVLDRIDAAMHERRIHVDVELYAALLMAIMPADFDIPDEPTKPTPTAPQTPERVAAYVARARAQVRLFHGGDASPLRGKQALQTRWRGHAEPAVIGWVAEGPPTQP